MANILSLVGFTRRLSMLYYQNLPTKHLLYKTQLKSDISRITVVIINRKHSQNVLTNFDSSFNRKPINLLN